MEFFTIFLDKTYTLRGVIWFQKSDLTKSSCHFRPFVQENISGQFVFAHDPVGTLLKYIIRWEVVDDKRL